MNSITVKILNVLSIVLITLKFVNAQGLDVPDGPCLDTGFRCINDCSHGPPTGNYQWCGSCRIYITCVGTTTYYMFCPSQLYWNDLFGQCLSATTVCHECVVYKPSTTAIPGLSTTIAEGDCLNTGSVCREECDGSVNGNFQWCRSCTKFLQCSGSESYIRDCQPGLVYDHNLRRCEYNSTTCECRLFTDPPNPCQGLPCGNDGTCVEDGQGGFNCLCRPGYTGDLCQTNIDECENEPCLNGGTCLDGENIYVCHCPDGFTGVNCETDIDECASNPCQNGGTCIDEVNGYVCQCRPGFTGAQCQTDIDECESSPCQNGGTCVDQENGFICICPPNFTGTQCQSVVGGCTSSPCLNGGTCVDSGNNYVCTCVPGYTGQQCQSEISGCSSFPCRSGSTCVPLPGGDWSCICQPGWTGRDCWSNINECDTQPCQGNSTCEDLENGYICICPPGFTGEDCRTPIHPCDSNPCYHGGTCRPVGGSSECDCPPNYTGMFCEIVIPPNFQRGCGTILNNAPPQVELPDQWHHLCYLLSNQTAYLNTACEFLLQGIPHYGNAAGLILAGGNYGCWIGRDFNDAERLNSCHIDYQHYRRLSDCFGCTIMTVCLKYPFEPPNYVEAQAYIRP